ncbi:granzyme 3, tandem duplicate 4 isoform X2 [Danio rerio]|uniref:Granzyme 3, tandem duplicate 4 isoform X2 n=1 Tax=Danio rerio TaxID=7955 RepID=A0AC58GCP3_DANRE
MVVTIHFQFLYQHIHLSCCSVFFCCLSSLCLEGWRVVLLEAERLNFIPDHTWHLCRDTTNLEVVLGAHNISQRENSQQIIQVQKYIKHPNYQKKNHSFDIMLLKLKTKAVLNHFVNITNLPKHEPSILAPVECSIAGWGMQRPGEGASNVLREVNLQLESNSYCKSKWQVYFNSKNMVCTASDGKKAFCQGDSGSPLFCNSELYGMAAYTYPNNCTFKEYPEVYMKVSAFLPWIKKNMK